MTDTCTACGCPVTDWAVHATYHQQLRDLQELLKDAVSNAYGMHLDSDRAQGTAAANAEVTV